MTKLGNNIRLRFAPSPTGMLHLGGARTALFNWIVARQAGGKFLLRMEDTDQKRSKKEFEESILDGLRWLGLDWDEDVVFQSKRKSRHIEVAQDLLAKGLAYYCVCPPDYDGKIVAQKGPCACRDRQESSGALRLKRPLEGSTSFHDLVYSDVEVSNEELDDMVLLRQNGDSTYLLGVAVDDHDMGVTHVVRGVDHLTNTMRQLQILKALNWDAPVYAHLPLIHGEDGKKLSKRHGACNVLEFRDLGFIPESMWNVLARMGWGLKDKEHLTIAEILELFDVHSLSKSSARFDMKKLQHFNQYHMQQLPADRLLQYSQEFKRIDFTPDEEEKAKALMPLIAQRAKTLHDIADGLAIFKRPEQYHELSQEGLEVVQKYLEFCEGVEWVGPALEAKCREFAVSVDLKLVKVAQPLRLAITGSLVSPPVFSLMEALGKNEIQERVRQYAQACKSE